MNGDLLKVPASAMSSFGNNVWKIMPVSAVNQLTKSQLQGLTYPQINSIRKSPNFAYYSSDIQAYVRAALGMSRSVNTNTLSSDAISMDQYFKLAGLNYSILMAMFLGLCFIF